MKIINKIEYNNYYNIYYNKIVSFTVMYWLNILLLVIFGIIALVLIICCINIIICLLNSNDKDDYVSTQNFNSNNFGNIIKGYGNDNNFININTGNPKIIETNEINENDKINENDNIYSNNV